jgi:hypothetical protein
MIGGSDFVIPTLASGAAFDACLRTIRRHWPNAIFQDAISGAKVDRFDAVPIGRWMEMFAYRDAAAARDWDEYELIPELAGTMVHLTRSGSDITITVDDVPGPEIKRMVDNMQRAIRMDIFTLPASVQGIAA